MRRVSLRAGDLTPGPPPRSPPPFHFPRDSQPVWRRRRRLLPDSQGIPGRPRRRAGQAGPAALARLSRRAWPAASGRGEGGETLLRPPREVSRLPSPEGGKCSASRRRLSPAVTVLAEAVSVSNSSSLSSLPIPLRGGDPAGGQAAGVAGAAVPAAGGPASTPSSRAAPTSAGCVLGVGACGRRGRGTPRLSRAGGQNTRQRARASWGARPPPAGRGTPSAERRLAGAPGGAGSPGRAKDGLGRAGRLDPCASYLAGYQGPVGTGLWIPVPRHTVGLQDT